MYVATQQRNGKSSATAVPHISKLQARLADAAGQLFPTSSAKKPPAFALYLSGFSLPSAFVSNFNATSKHRSEPSSPHQTLASAYLLSAAAFEVRGTRARGLHTLRRAKPQQAPTLSMLISQSQTGQTPDQAGTLHVQVLRIVTRE